MTELPSAPPVLRLRGISKRFGDVQALHSVDAEFAAGEVHAVLGENGAGKSTLMKVIYGLVQADEGLVELEGRPLAVQSPRAAREAGIGMVHQELALVDALSIRENLALSLSPDGWILDLAEVDAAARKLASEVGLEIGDTARPVGEVPVGVRQRVEILRELAGRTRVLILDEPTAVLTPGEVGQLFRVLEGLRRRGVAVIFITHKLREVMAIADRVTVLRRGAVVQTARRDEVTESGLAERMMGKIPTAAARHRLGSPERVRLRMEGVSLGAGAGALTGVSLTVGAGEVVGVAGVDGNGQSELFDVLAGLRRPAAGVVRVDGEVLHHDTSAVLESGIELIPPDRGRQGLILTNSVKENAVLNRSILRSLVWGPFLPAARVERAARALVDGYGIQTASLDVPAASLSGGNQQRLVVARSLSMRPRVLVAFNPTRGLDAGASQAVYAALDEAAQRGTAILLISTDLDEVLELSDRIVVLYRGRMSEPLHPPFDPQQLGLLMAGARLHVPV